MGAPALPFGSTEGPGDAPIVSGGSRGLAVEYGELGEAGGKLEETAERLQDLRFRGTDLCFRLRGLSALPEPASRAADAVDAAVQGLIRGIGELEDTARSLRKAGENYLEVEGRVEQEIKAVQGGVPAAVTALVLWGHAGWGYPGRIVSELMVPDTEDTAEKLESRLSRHGFLGPIAVSKQGGNHGTVLLGGTARDLLERSRVLEQEDNGIIEVLTAVRGGQRLQVVTLPGTQNDPAPGASNPFDNYGNVEGLGGDSRYVADAVAEALRQAGASSGDSVILVGYSQGGIHAVNTAARLAQEGEFSMEMVLTAGTPRGGRNIPKGVRALHLEHREDWVAGADGASNADTPDRITVTGTAPVPLTEGGDGGLGPAHRLGVYLDLAAQADDSSDPSLKESLGHLAEIVGPGTLATRGLFTFSRKPARRSPARLPLRLPRVRPPLLGTVPSLPKPASPVPMPVLPAGPLDRLLPAGPGQ